MINIKQPPGIDLIGQRELYNYLSELATELNREFLKLDGQIKELERRTSVNAKKVNEHTTSIAALDERVTALEDE